MSDDEVWEDDDHQSKSSVIDDCDISESEDITTLNYNGGSRVEILVTWIIAFLAALQRKHLIPDSAIGTLLKFLGTIFKVLSPLSTEITQLSRAFPSSFHMMLKFAAVKKDDFLTFVVPYIIMRTVSKVAVFTEKVNIVQLLCMVQRNVILC